MGIKCIYGYKMYINVYMGINIKIPIISFSEVIGQAIVTKNIKE